MTREEAIARGLEVHDTQHSMKRRSPWHDYYRKGTYMLTLVVEGRRPLLGRLIECGDEASVELSALGEKILRDEVPKISRFYPKVKVWKICFMPDHIHMIVRVEDDLEKGRHLGKVVIGFKTGCNNAYWTMFNMTNPPRKGLFENGYNDKILMNDGQLDGWKAYLDDNPRRLLMKRKNPQLFTLLQEVDVAGKKCQMVGNRFLLDIPDKVAVIVHRRYSEEEIASRREMWLACGERGGVLVSAAISPKEKVILREALNRGYRIILLRENGFPKLYKPSGASFDACAKGLLLQISPWDYHIEKRAITRAQCLELNRMAEVLAGEK
ncbi:MAG: hypothetical protein Q4B68_02485 [Bacteroidales bacterium]|nr:hypothetical protein [Bacteroidales bacterium]